MDFANPKKELRTQQTMSLVAKVGRYAYGLAENIHEKNTIILLFFI